MWTWEPTDESWRATFCDRATACTAEWKHAANPAANSSSGLAAPPAPPISRGTARSRSSTPSLVRTLPLRAPPVERASAV
ncbi:hypothetical protein BJF88_07810 [Cellulosimicrobium sp. CUA-896]|nr:hypothetical protein BJF88_07810 [Cellulosimicrobium sp. CUA-896]